MDRFLRGVTASGPCSHERVDVSPWSSSCRAPFTRSPDSGSRMQVLPPSSDSCVFSSWVRNFCIRSPGCARPLEPSVRGFSSLGLLDGCHHLPGHRFLWPSSETDLRRMIACPVKETSALFSSLRGVLRFTLPDRLPLDGDGLGTEAPDLTAPFS